MGMGVVKRDRQPGAVPGNWPDERIDRAFRDMFREFFTGGMFADRFLDRFSDTWPHPIHLEEYVEGDSCVIRAELPGVDPENDIEITLADGVLTLSAHREQRSEEERPSGYRSEFRYGSFSRSVRLPEGAVESDVKAAYRDGVLEVRVPVAPAQQQEPVRIAVQHD